MKKMRYKNTGKVLAVAAIIGLAAGCTRDFDDLPLAGFPENPLVFIDNFSSGLQYAAFGGSYVSAFEVDMDVTYEGSAAMRFEVPNADNPQGSYAGGVFYTDVGRDLTKYDALTMWVKSSKSATLDLVGFGNDLGELKYTAFLRAVPMTTNWTKVIIPIPDPSKLTAERGMLYYTEAPEDSTGYTFWIDEVKFEKLGTIAYPRGRILEAQEQNISAETGDTYPIGGTFVVYNMPDGTDQRVEAAPAYFDFTASDSTVASIDDFGVVSVLDSGFTAITAELLDARAQGIMFIAATGALPAPQVAAPAPTEDPEDVISLFSDYYTNVPVDRWNTFWEFSTAETIEGIFVEGDEIKRYKKLNFVGIEFTSQTIDVSEMSRFHMDIWTSDPTALPAAFKVLLVDFGPDDLFEGDDGSSHEVSFTAPTLKTEQWVSLDVPMSDFAGLLTRGNLAQMVLSGDLTNVYIDNVYFYDDGSGGGISAPTEAAPIPSEAPGDVLSIYSDTYTDVEGTNFNPDWGQSTSFTELQIEGNNTFLYAGLNYQGIDFASAQDVSGESFLHVDFWSETSTALNVYLISSGEPAVETAYVLNVPTDGWGSVDIPLGDFAPVDLTDVIQMKFDGNGTVYVDNIYFH